MKPLNQKIVKIKNLIGIIENPTLEDLLFEIVSFLDSERRYDSEFKTHEAFLKTRVRISSLLSEDLDELVKLGYLEKLKYSNYRVIKHLWEKGE
jgi:hypothetical protein